MLSSRLLLSSFLAVFALCACDSKVTSLLDTDLQAKVKTVTDCIPPQMEKLNELLDFSELWRQGDNSNNPADPAGLTWSYAGGEITYSIAVGSFTIAGRIQFFSPAGAQQTSLTLSTVSLSQAIDDAATELRMLFTSGRPFMVGEWTITGAGVSSRGITSSPASLTGHIAGSANQNELEEVQTTEGVAAVSGGSPPVQDCEITTTGAETCVFTFRIDSLLTDESPTQEYPIGTITWTLTNQTENVTVAGTLVFDGTVIAVLNVTDVGTFNINIETRDVTAQ